MHKLPRQVVREKPQHANTFLVLDMADLIWVETNNFESRTSPKCLCSTTCITGKLLKRITG